MCCFRVKITLLCFFPQKKVMVLWYLLCQQYCCCCACHGLVLLSLAITVTDEVFSFILWTVISKLPFLFIAIMLAIQKFRSFFSIAPWVNDWGSMLFYICLLPVCMIFPETLTLPVTFDLCQPHGSYLVCIFSGSSTFRWHQNCFTLTSWPWCDPARAWCVCVRACVFWRKKD